MALLEQTFNIYITGESHYRREEIISTSLKEPLDTLTGIMGNVGNDGLN